MFKYNTDIDYYDKEINQFYGDIEWNTDGYQDSETTDLNEAIENVRICADFVASECDSITIFTIYETSGKEPIPTYVLAYCTKQDAVKYGIDADEYLLDN